MKFKHNNNILDDYEKEKEITGFEVPKTLGKPVKKAGFFSTGEEELKRLLSLTSLISVKEFILSIQELRAVTKDISTYYEGYRKVCWEDNCIHTTYNHAATDTSRLSSSKPNVQNSSGKD